MICQVFLAFRQISDPGAVPPRSGNRRFEPNLLDAARRTDVSYGVENGQASFALIRVKLNGRSHEKGFWRRCEIGQVLLGPNGHLLQDAEQICPLSG